MLVVFAGLPATGKSTLARLLAKELDALWLRVDTIEAALLASGIPQSFETGLAAYEVVAAVARDHLRLGRSIIIDAVNGVEPARQMWRDLAVEFDAVRYVVELACSDPEEHRRRAEARPPATPPLALPTWQEIVHREYEPWTETVLTLDGLNPPAENLARALSYLRADPVERA